MQHVVEQLRDAIATRVLAEMAVDMLRQGHFETQLTPEIQQGLRELFELKPSSDSPPDGDIARQALVFMSRDKTLHSAIAGYVEETRLDNVTKADAELSAEAAALVVLQRNVEFEHDADGSVRAKIAKEPLSRWRLKALAQMLISRRK